MERNGTTYNPATPSAVVDVLERARHSGQRIRLFYGDAETGASWQEENDVLGTVGRSTGRIKIPLIIANARSKGGPSILDHCIVAIATGPGRFAYRHPQFSAGTWTTGPAESPDYQEAAFCDGKLHAQFRKAGQAARYVAFMKGERFAK